MHSIKQKSIAIATALTIAASLEGSVFRDAIYWMRTPQDLDGSGNLSRAAADGELPDTFRATSSGCSEADASNTDSIRIEKMEVKNPYTGIVTPNVSCLKMTGGPAEVDGVLKWRPGRVRLPDLMNYSYGADYSFAVRFKYAGRPTSGSKAASYNRFIALGLDSKSGGVNGKGLSFGFRNTQTINQLTYWASFGGKDLTADVTGPATNMWLDVVGTMDHTARRLTVYTAYGEHLVVTNEFSYPDTATDTTGGNVARIGWTSSANLADVESVQTFVGDIAEFAIWNRVLSSDEAIEFFEGTERGWSWQIGAADGTAREFVGAAGASVCTNGDQWASLPGTLTSAGDKFSVAFPFDVAKTLSASNAARSALVAIKTTGASGSGTIRPRINGTALNDIDIGPNKEYLVWIDSQYIQDLNRFDLERVSGSASIDAVYGGCSWQIGYLNNSSAELNGEGDDVFRIESPSMKKFHAVLTGPGHGLKSSRFSVDLPDSVAMRHPWRITWRWKHMYSATSTSSVLNGIRLNGRTLNSYDVTSLYSDETLKLPLGLLHSGMNEIELYRAGETDYGKDWDVIDYVKLEPLTAPTGFILSFR